MPEQPPYLPTSELDPASSVVEHSLSRQAEQRLTILLNSPDVLNQINQNSVVVRHVENYGPR